MIFDILKHYCRYYGLITTIDANPGFCMNKSRMCREEDCPILKDEIDHPATKIIEETYNLGKTTVRTATTDDSPSAWITHYNIVPWNVKIPDNQAAEDLKGALNAFWKNDGFNEEERKELMKQVFKQRNDLLRPLEERECYECSKHAKEECNYEKIDTRCKNFASKIEDICPYIDKKSCPVESKLLSQSENKIRKLEQSCKDLVLKNDTLLWTGILAIDGEEKANIKIEDALAIDIFPKKWTESNIMENIIEKYKEVRKILRPEEK